jgi:imidazole glycerol phosphate synthase glutamine amidotransferase subunit
VASVASAFNALGATPLVTRDPEVARGASHLVLPGVGSFGAGMAALRASGLDAVVREAAERGTPLLAICLGLQLLTEGSDESPGVAGLGVIRGRCERLPGSVRVPQLGWNAVRASDGATLVRDGYAAYANSFVVTEPPEGWTASWTSHGTRFVAALERDRILACQFHPELSGRWGMDLLARWVEGEAGIPGDRAISRLAPRASRLSRRIIPCLDVADGRIVKGVRFQNLRDAGDPAERAARYEAQGADEIVVLDIAASPEQRDTQAETVRRVRAAVRIPLTVGGGVRSVADAARLLAAGADKVSVNTAAVTNPRLVTDLAAAFGCQCTVLAVDSQRKTASTDYADFTDSSSNIVRLEYASSRLPERLSSAKSAQSADAVFLGWQVLINGGRAGTGRDTIEWIRTATGLGAGEILLTSWDRDGTRSGADLDLLRAASGAVPVPVIASGGIGVRQDIADAFDAGADAVLAASIFHDGDDTVTGVKEWLMARDYAVRP